MNQEDKGLRGEEEPRGGGGPNLEVLSDIRKIFTRVLFSVGSKFYPLPLSSHFTRKWVYINNLIKTCFL